MTSEEVRFRLVRANDIPATNPNRLAYKFGLQDTKQGILEGRRLAGKLTFDFTLKVKKGLSGEPIFTGPYRAMIDLSISPGSRSPAATT